MQYDDASGRFAGYGVTARVLHWLTALLVLIMIPIGLIMTQELPRETQNALFIIHKNLGPVVLIVVLARLAWRLFNPPPPLPSSVPSAQRLAAGVVHVGLYAALIVMAVSGYVRVTAGGFPIEVWDALGAPRLFAENEALANRAKAVHFAASRALIALILVHVAAAAHHGIARRDGVLARMWPPFRT